MSFSLIAAVAKNNCIGVKNKIPWNIPEDFQYFKKMTLGKTCLMGEATFKSILGYLGKPLPGRQTVVVTIDRNFKAPARNATHSVAGGPEGVRVFYSLDDAFDKLKSEEVFVCGGASIYRQTIDRVDTLYITMVNLEPDGDVFFPKIDPKVWKEVWREDHDGYSFLKFSKK